MGQMSLRLATEVRHSLHSMLGFLELALEEPLSERQSAYLAQCRTSADRLLRIAADLSELSQSDPSPQPSSSFQAGAAVYEVAEMTRVFAERKGLVLECSLSPASQLRIQGMRELIQDTVRRLLDNAVQFTEHGTIRLFADVHVERNEARLLLEVADTGAGMPAEVLAALNSTGEPLPGRGLSLMIVRHRMAKMGGDLSVVSRPKSGTIVRLTIPVRLDSPEGLNESKTPQDHERAPLNLLVAEDSDDSFFVFEGYVRDQGHKLTRAYDGAQAVEMAQTGRFHVIVMDANMPIMDGYSATRAIREWESDIVRSERTPILLFSADDPLKQAKLGGTAGCSGYLTKPATKAEVLRALDYFSSSGLSLLDQQIAAQDK